MMYDIAVADEQSAAAALDTDRLIDLARQVLAAEGVAEAEISLALVDDPTIARLNRQFLEHTGPTDVISFLLDEQPPLDLADTPPAPTPRGWGKRLSGEIVLSTETASRVAGELGCPVEHEVYLYLVHGLLHLCGYDDLTPPERQLMRTRERQLLSPHGIHPKVDDVLPSTS